MDEQISEVALEAFWTSLAGVFLLELGDKTQLVALSLASKFRTRVVLAGILTATLAVHGEVAAAQCVTLESRLPEGDCAVSGDPNCVSVLLDNLVDNAIKYNKPGGSVAISAEVRGGEVELAVSDTGIGIPEQYRERLFDEFFRVANGDGKDGGTGLGLAICRKVATELGGSIRVESEVGAGSTFRVRLPAWES
jgi:signal transduction histidine kinase